MDIIANVAMSIRAYGTISVENVSGPADLQAILTPEYVAKNFESHGAGDDDYDFSQPEEIYITDIVGHTADDNVQNFSEFEFEVYSPSWAYQQLYDEHQALQLATKDTIGGLEIALFIYRLLLLVCGIALAYVGYFA